ncbi:glycoside hydrolase family 127 protein [Haladaptatus halobius]|uniref:glycoside hydrolase family 127 protein n=1 Tax=Haladaptatus halobius TaxID=2884875 RepID=UPI001D09AECE|nr:beta-L-arabinofuranosidase domain-containing protein [Haladaptatus halobius]
MSDVNTRQVVAIPYENITITDEFWESWLRAIRENTLRSQYEQLATTGCLDNFRRVIGQSDGKFEGMWFEDSDAYKWIEAVSHTLSRTDDPELRERLDDVVSLVVDAQADDGYLNTYVMLEAPNLRSTNLNMLHELYCAGHLIEAAVAHHRATGEERLLAVAQALADLVDGVFGPDGRDGTPGHEEIELALVELYRVTDEVRYLDLARFFIDQRGRGTLKREFENQAEQAGDEDIWDGARSEFFEDGCYDGSYAQDHAPVVEQETVEGHAVRAMYLFAGVADVVLESGGTKLFTALERLWEGMVDRRMYVTGGIGSTHKGERFTEDYHLPNDTSYAETCATVGSIFWNQRMFLLTGDTQYLNLVERTLYNGFLAGISLNATEFFYANPLQVDSDGHALHDVDPIRFSNERQDWFDCACCPPNAARLLASLGDYLYARSASTDAIYVNHFVESEVIFSIRHTDVRLRQETKYPWAGDVTLRIDVAKSVPFPLHVRVPDWCETVSATLNGEELSVDADAEYLTVDREWETDELAVTFEMRPELLVAHPTVRADIGNVALRYGPLIYCLEEVDNERPLHHYAISETGKVEAEFEPGLLNGVVTLTGSARLPATEEWEGTLYRLFTDTATVDAEFTAVPYYAWANREPGEMRVWLRSVLEHD